VSYTILDKATNQPRVIMEPAEFQAFRSAPTGNQALMMSGLTPQYSLDLGSVGLYAMAGNTAKANESLVAAATQPDYARDVGFAFFGAAIGVVSGAKPGAAVFAEANASGKPPVRTGAYEGVKVRVDETTMPAVSERALPPAQGRLTGEPEVSTSSKGDQARSIARQNEAAETLSQRGLDVERLPNDSGRGGQKNPDLKINGEVADVYSPKTGNVQQVLESVSKKSNPLVGEQQAPNVVVNLADSPLSISEAAQYIARNPVPRLTRLIIIKNGQVVVLTFGG
jgi:arsenate reductase-like glutaredoxin family protein